jgi:hypothetical protein
MYTIPKHILHFETLIHTYSLTKPKSHTRCFLPRREPRRQHILLPEPSHRKTPLTSVDSVSGLPLHQHRLLPIRTPPCRGLLRTPKDGADIVPPRDALPVPLHLMSPRCEATCLGRRVVAISAKFCIVFLTFLLFF